MAQLLNNDIIKQIREVFDDLKQPVHMIFFGNKENCEYCDETRQLVEEVAAISDLVSIVFYDLDEDADLAQKYNIDKTPGLVIAAKEGDQVTDFGVRMSGIPSGHEFTSLIQDIVLVSNRDSGLNPQPGNFLKTWTNQLLYRFLSHLPDHTVRGPWCSLIRWRWKVQ